MLKEKAMEFKAKYKISNQSSLKYIKRVIRAMNCNLCRYSDEKLKLIELGVDVEAKSAPALTVISPDGDITVYYNDRKSPTIQRFALCHEIGHIILKHKYSDIPPLLQEQESDLFAELLLSPFQEEKKKTDNHKILIGTLLTLLMTIVITFILYLSLPPKSESQPNKLSSVPQMTEEITASVSETVYYTKYGEVYHKSKDCYYLKNSKSIYSGTIESSAKDRPCSACW
jgi:hypothetical protein